MKKTVTGKGPWENEQHYMERKKGMEWIMERGRKKKNHGEELG